MPVNIPGRARTGVVFPTTNPERKAVGVLALYDFNWELPNVGLEAAYSEERETAERRGMIYDLE